jgi:cell wall-associated NlpC family hydrolase
MKEQRQMKAANWQRKSAFWITIVIIVIASGCGNVVQKQQSGNTNSNEVQLRQLKVNATHAAVPLVHIDNRDYVNLAELSTMMGWHLKVKKLEGVALFGDNDANYEVHSDSKQALKDGESVSLKEQVIIQDDKVYLPASSVTELFHEEFSFGFQDGQLILHAVNDAQLITDPNIAELPSSNSGAPSFSEDPADPLKNINFSSKEAEAWNQIQEKITASGEEAAIPAAAQSNTVSKLIQAAKRYLGVPFDFAADPYPNSGKFDCSSYTQYLFGKYGVTLPRIARQQAKLGSSVSPSKLRKGDLLYFYVPGRFKTNKTVGHVGIYIGGNQMIHASPKPKDGVQITNINNAYWRNSFLFAKRISLK